MEYWKSAVCDVALFENETVKPGIIVNRILPKAQLLTASIFIPVICLHIDLVNGHRG